MKRKMFLKTNLVLISIILLASCSNENLTEADETVVEEIEAVIHDDAEMDDMMDIISNQIENVTAFDIEASFPLTSSLKSMQTTITYPVKTVEYPESPKKWPRIITVDYGSENIPVTVRDTENVMLKGKVIITKSINNTVKGAERTVSFEKFYVNDYHIVGSKVYTNIGDSDNGNPVFKSIVNIKATSPDKFWRKRKVRREREMVVGNDTKEWKDNEYSVTGETRGSNSNKWEHERTIIVPLHKYADYKYPVSGVVEVVNTKRKFTIDYGDGEKDNIATFTFDNGKVKEVELNWKIRLK